ncbi:MAG TPA: hypothetical protein VNJ08_01505 [Bacteriovoracaceae bacterium]|nr:hypothetical protein [Bacteriovoracaceae bacterium]
MDLDQAIMILRKAVKHTGTIDQKHIDLTVIPVDEKPLYEKALVVTQLAVKDGKLSRDELLARLHLN